MAYIKLFIVFTILAISIPYIYGVEHIVGDESGWTINFDYQAWAQGKVFHVGDKLGKCMVLYLGYPRHLQIYC